MSKARWASVFIAAVSGSLFLASLAFPTFQFSPTEQFFEPSRQNALWPGSVALMVGWLGLLKGYVAWYANPIWGYSLYSLAKQKYSRASSWAALGCLVALTSFGIHSIEINEGGAERTIYALGLGFYLWLASIVVVACGAGIISLSLRKPASRPNTLNPPTIS